jgi:putative SOS response-associated peptidase YedK
MCGRVKTPEKWSEIKAANKIKWGEYRDGGRRYNVPPTTVIDIIRYDAERGGKGIEQMRWGLVPYWSLTLKTKRATFNARAETVDKLATFRNAWKAGRRCLVPIDNFYEWRKSDMQPFAIAMANRSAMMLAGLWETWKPPTAASWCAASRSSRWARAAFSAISTTAPRRSSGRRTGMPGWGPNRRPMMT